MRDMADAKKKQHKNIAGKGETTKKKLQQSI